MFDELLPQGDLLRNRHLRSDALLAAVAVAYVLTGSWRMALAIGLVEPFVQTFAFALHERAWNRAAARANDCNRVEGTAATPLRGAGVSGGSMA